MPEPTLKKLRSDAHEKRQSGRQREVSQSTRLFTPLSVSVCHTIAHAPYPAKASHMPTTAPASRPMELEAATMRTSMHFISLLVCTIAEALRMKLRNITRLSGTSRWSPLKQSAIRGAARKRIA